MIKKASSTQGNEKNKRQKTSKNEAAGIISSRGEGRGAIVRFISDSVDATHGRENIQLESLIQLHCRDLKKVNIFLSGEQSMATNSP